MAMQEPILVMDLQGIPAGKWDWTKRWLHLKYIEEERTQIASHPTNYYMGTGEKFLNRTAMACAIRSGIDKWDLIKFNASVRQRTLLIRQKGNHQIGKRSLPILHLSVG